VREFLIGPPAVLAERPPPQRIARAVKKTYQS
jgi:hypothetical protein